MNFTKEESSEFRKSILEDNSILYMMHKRPMIETCMCWGLEVPDVWLNELEKLSMKLEAMNYLMYPKHRVRIQADQVKSKFAELRFYYTVVVDPPSWICFYERMMEKFFSLLNRLDYKLIKVVDRDEYDEVVDKPIAPEDVDEEIKRCKMITNSDVIDDPANKDKKIRRTILHHCAKVHYEPTKHKILHKILCMRYIIKNFLRDAVMWHPSHKQDCIRKFVDGYAFKLIADATDELACVCEQCGRMIGKPYSSARCITLGWISYLCEKCADESEMLYRKNDEIWKSGAKVKDVEDKKKSSEEDENDAKEEDDES